MHTSFLLKDLAVIMTIAAGVMYICFRLRQPAIIGYLLAGLIIGPHTPPFSLVSDTESIRSISELGLVFLMFSLGLEFSLPRLRKAGLQAAMTAAVVVGGMLLTGLVAGEFLGWTLPGSLLLGGILAISGSTIIAKVFFDLHITQEPFARAVFGLMICDDVAAMIMLSVVSGFTAQSASIAAATSLALIKITFFILLFLTLGLLFVPRILDKIAAFKNTELTGIAALGLCFAGAYTAASFNFSIALGTFLMGAIVAATPYSEEIEKWTAPLRDMFSALFFVSAGMLVDPRSVAEHWPAMLLILVLVIAGRAFWGITASLLAGHEPRMSVKIGLSSAQIGEFSFILAAAGAAAGIVPDWLYGTTVASAMLTIFIFPYLMRNLDLMENTLLSKTPKVLLELAAKYRAAVWPHAARQTAERPPIFSKYLLRLVVYVTVATGLLYAAGSVSVFIAFTDNRQTFDSGLWLLTGLALMPLFLAVARYISHIILLTGTIAVTRLAPRAGSAFNVKAVYTASNIFCLALLGAAFLTHAATWLEEGTPFFIFTGVFLIICLLMRRQLLAMMDYAEQLLDQIIGLATSEPTHQITAVRESKNPDDSATTRWLVGKRSRLADKTLRELEIRRKTGAGIIAIYRAGTNIFNPVPDTKLQSGDIIFLFGSQQQCDRADLFLERCENPPRRRKLAADENSL